MLPDRLAEVRAAHQRVHVLVKRGVLLGWLEARLLGDGLRRHHVRGGAQRRVRGRIDVGIVKDDTAVGLDLPPEERQVLGDRHLDVDAPDPAVRGEIEGDLSHHPDRAVAADRGEEQLRVIGPAGRDDAAIGQDEGDPANGPDERPLADVAPVRVDGERATDREGVVGLHDLHRQAVAVDHRLQLAPRGARANGHRAEYGVQRDDAMKRPHVDLETVRRRRLATHAVASPANGDETSLGANRGRDVADGVRRDGATAVRSDTDGDRRGLEIPDDTHADAQRHEDRCGSHRALDCTLRNASAPRPCCRRPAVAAGHHRVGRAPAWYQYQACAPSPPTSKRHLVDSTVW